MGDFVLQPSYWVKNKKENKLKSPYLYLHVSLHALLLSILLGFKLEYAIVIGCISFSHLVIDAIKVCYQNEKNEIILFFIDQLFHVAFILLILIVSQKTEIRIEDVVQPKVILLALCIVFVTTVSGVLIGKVLSIWDLGKEYSSKSLKDAGVIIGYIERILIVIFVIFDVWAAIGFLIAAKSVFRFGDLSIPENRKISEYFLIGTLLSFGLAILIGLLYNYIVSTQFIST